MAFSAKSLPLSGGRFDITFFDIQIVPKKQSWQIVCRTMASAYKKYSILRQNALIMIVLYDLDMRVERKSFFVVVIFA